MFTCGHLLRKSVIGIPFAITLAFGLTIAPTTNTQAQIGASESLEEVVVTARRRQETLLDVPVAISVLTADFAEEANILDTFDLYAETPGVDYEQTRERQGGRTTMRGINPGSQNPINQLVSIFIDGAPLFGTNASMAFTDLERVEVLRGPQSAAFGRATFAGAVNYVTRDPGEEFESKVKMTVSDQNRSILGAALGGPITDNLGFTLDVANETFDAPDEWVTTDGYKFGSTSTKFVSGKLKWAPSDFFDMEIMAQMTDVDDGPGSEYLIPGDTVHLCNNHTLANGRPYIKGEFNCTLNSGPNPRNHDLRSEYTKGTTDYNKAWAESITNPGAIQDRERISGEFNFNLSGGSLVQIVGSSTEDVARRWIDSDMSDAKTAGKKGFSSRNTGNMGNRRGSDKETYLDVRWISPGDQQLRWLVGFSSFDFGYSDAAINEFMDVEHPEHGLACLLNDCKPFEPARRQNVDTSAQGIYGSITYDVNDRLTLGAEGRVQRDEQLTRDIVSTETIVQVTDSFQPRLSFNYMLNDSFSLYGQLAQGGGPATATPEMINPTVQAASEAAKKAGFINYTAADFAKAKEQTLTNLEFGVKGSALDGRLQLTAAIYAIDWQDMMINERFIWTGEIVEAGGCAGKPTTVCWNDGTYTNGLIYDEDYTDINGVRKNSGTGDLKGIELETNYVLNDNWSFRYTMSLQDNKYGHNCDYSMVDRFGYTATGTTEGGAGCYDVIGNEIERNAELQYSLSAQFTAPAVLGGGWEWSGRLGTRYASSRYYDVANLMSLPASNTVTGQVRFTNDNWDVIVFGNNLTNSSVPLDVDDYRDRTGNVIAGGGWTQKALADNTWRYRPRLPREVGLRINYTF